MPVTYARDDERRLIMVTVTTPYAVDDILRVIDRQAAENAWGYAMLYDLRAEMLIVADAQRVADYVNAIEKGRARGPVGLAISGQSEEFRRGLPYSEMTRHIEAVEVLLTTTQLEDWLARNAPYRKTKRE
jgi:hypothetical protein